MTYFSDDGSIDTLLKVGGSGFNDDVRASILSFQVQAKASMIQMMETGMTQSNIYGMRVRRGYWNSSFSGSYAVQRRERARQLYKDQVEKTETAEDRYIHDRLARAESLLCLFHAMPVMGLRPTAGGGFTSSITSTDQVIPLLSARQINARKQGLWNQANALVEDVLFEKDYRPSVCHAF